MEPKLSHLRSPLIKGITYGLVVLLAVFVDAISDAVPYVPLCVKSYDMLRFKEGTKVTFTKEVNAILEAADYTFDAHGYQCVCTSGIDGKHMEGSLHYKALAVDLRSRHVAADALPKIVYELRGRLGKDYDVIIEGDHIHAEYDPKTS